MMVDLKTLSAVITPRRVAPRRMHRTPLRANVTSRLMTESYGFPAVVLLCAFRGQKHIW